MAIDSSSKPIISLSLNSIVQQELNSGSQLGIDIKSHIGKQGTISSNLIFAVLEKHLKDVESQTSILLIDRKISIPSVEANTDYTTVIKLDYVGNNIEHIGHPNGDIAQIVNHSNVTSEPPTISVKEHGKDKMGKLIQTVKKFVFGIEPQPQPTPETPLNNGNRIQRYFEKMKGGEKKPPYDRPVDALLSFITSFIGIGVLTSIDYYLLANTTNTLVIGSFGATAVLLFSAIKSPLAQPRNLIFGHLQAALIGVTMQFLLGANYPWLAAPLAVSLSIGIMCLTHTVHPPAGATAIIAVYSDQKIHSLGFLYTLLPVEVGALILLIVALVTNNVFPSRRYPQYWY